MRAKFSGILNGIDTADWDPAADPLLPANYDAARPGGKALCKQYLQRGLGLEENPGKPLVVVVTRCAPPLLLRAAARCGFCMLPPILPRTPRPPLRTAAFRTRRATSAAAILKP